MQWWMSKTRANWVSPSEPASRSSSDSNPACHSPWKCDTIAIASRAVARSSEVPHSMAMSRASSASCLAVEICPVSHARFARARKSRPCSAASIGSL